MKRMKAMRVAKELKNKVKIQALIAQAISVFFAYVYIINKLKKVNKPKLAKITKEMQLNQLNDLREDMKGIDESVNILVIGATELSSRRT